MTSRLALSAALVLLACTAGQALSPPQDFVEDRAAVLDVQTRADLSTRLRRLERETGARLAVLTIQTTGGESIEAYALRTARDWKLGQSGKDNGVLVVVAVKDRKYRIEVGKGLESTLTDPVIASLTDDCFRSNFRRGDYAAGIRQGVLALADRVAPAGLIGAAAASHTDVTPRRAPSFPAHNDGSPWPGLLACGGLSFVLLVVIVAVTRGLRRNRRRIWRPSASWSDASDVTASSFGSAATHSSAHSSPADSGGSIGSGGGDFGGAGHSGGW